MKVRNNYYDILDQIPFEILKNWCEERLSSVQRKEIIKINWKVANNLKNKKTYLYYLDGTWIDSFDSRTECADYLGSLLNKKCSHDYISNCIIKHLPIYKRFWVTDSFPFDAEKYNNDDRNPIGRPIKIKF